MRVLITGGTGFLGRALVAYLREHFPAWQVVVYSRDEQKQAAMARRFPWVEYILGDVCDPERLIMAAQGAGRIVHAAAMKYIPEGESNPGECIRVNVTGTANVLAAALRTGTAEPTRLVVISTDKACQPANVYGATKFMCERMTAEYAARTGLLAHTVRYGNVVGSTGSVIPVWRRQLQTTGRITVTDPEMTRFWMGIGQACETVMVGLSEVDPG